MDGKIFHILNRGVNKQNIFLNKYDYLRFIESLYLLNNKEGAIRLNNRKNVFVDFPDQNKLVEIFCWTLMPNHYHVLVQEVLEGGAVEFAKRLGNSYTKYFNIKNKRSGYLFQNSAKIIEIIEDKHFLYLPLYIDLNPLKLFQFDWKEKGIKNKKQAEKFLAEYRYSSISKYFDNNSEFNFLSNSKLFYEIFNVDEMEYKKELLSWFDGIK